MSTIAEILPLAEAALADSGIAQPRREASSLLAFAVGKDKAFLIAHPEYVLNSDEETHFADCLARRARREPFQYITGRQEFYGLDFIVTPDVLIPRPETEMVVEHAIRVLGVESRSRFCEVGVGSGSISIAILKNMAGANAVGLDVSMPAIEVARRNAVMHRVDDRLELRESDVFSALGDEKFNLVVSNPPYIPVKELPSLQHEVRDFEPKTALTDGADGLAIIRRIVDQSPRHLEPGGHLIMEIGFQQAGAVRGLLSAASWRDIDIADDLQGIPRCVIARRPVD